MRNLRILAALGLPLGLLSAAGAAQAELSANATVVTDYDFRGVTQSNEDPALQLGIDWADESGWYVGTWGSNVDFGGDDPSHEVDIYTGFSGETAGGLGWDAGVVYYIYPGESDFNYPEIYGSFSYSIFSGSLYYSNDYAGVSESAFYTSADLAIPVSALSIDLHAGYSDGDGIDAVFGDSYADYSLGVSYAANNFTVGMKWVTTDIDALDDRVVLSFGTSFPWAE